MIQAGSLDGRHRAVERALTRAYRDVLGDGRVTVVWTEIPRGQSFTDFRPSSMSWVMAEVDDDLDATVRADALHAMSEAWTGATGATSNELMVALCDTAWFDRYLDLNRSRIDPLAQPKFLARTGLRLIAAKLRTGRLAMPANHGGA
ncbi:hypothetical protein ACWDOP_24430 [Nocardia sp. NPDC003693]